MSTNENKIIPATRFNESRIFLNEPFKMIERHMREFDEMINQSFKNEFKLIKFDKIGSLEHLFVKKDGKYVYEIPKDLSKEDLKFVTIEEEDRMIRITIEQKIFDEGKNFKSSSIKQSQQLLSIPDDAIPGTAVAKYSNKKLSIFVDR